MTLPTIGTTPGAQTAAQSIAATSDANGAITFIGPAGIQGSTITCVVTVPSASPGAIFTATLGTPNGMGVALGAWGGQSTAGRFQIKVGQTLVVKGIGLSKSTAYAATFAMVIDVGDVQLVTPEPNTFQTSPVASSIASGSYSVYVTVSQQVLAPVAGRAYSLFDLTIICSAWNSTGQLYQDPTGAVPAPAGEVLFSWPSTGTFTYSFRGFMLLPGNGLYITASGGSAAFVTAGTYQQSYS